MTSHFDCLRTQPFWNQKEGIPDQRFGRIKIIHCTVHWEGTAKEPTTSTRQLPVNTTRLLAGNCILALLPHAFPRMYPVTERISNLPLGCSQLLSV
jgi:hypothetical protein